MLFVGDHPLYDAPQDPRVVFHLEGSATTRPAGELQRLVLHLRQLGKGSLQTGFTRLHSSSPGALVRRSVPGVGKLLLVARDAGHPAIAFEDSPPKDAPCAEQSFVPAEIVAQLRSSLALSEG
jgi:hypothetical protein